MLRSLRGRSNPMICLLQQSFPFSLHRSSNYPSNCYRILQRRTPPSCILGFLGSNSRIRSREYCSNSHIGVKSMATAKVLPDTETVSYLNQREAAEIDEILMGPLGFSVDQLMELAGLSVAASIAEVYKPNEYNRVLVICGPGNNGGDGLVAARHLFHFGYKPVICYPKRTAKALYTGLATQLESLSIPFLAVEDLPADLAASYDVVVDAIFGFSFHGTPRPPFDDVIERLVSLRNANQKQQKFPAIVSVDIPSGWNVEQGDPNGQGIKPDMLVSLTAPKLCAKKFYGPHHFLGGRFVPPFILDKFKLDLPEYSGTSVEKVSDEESENYFHSRPRGSQIGAIVSRQSTVISGRQALHERQEELELLFTDGTIIPKPAYWGGYRLKPNLFEFWQGQPSRLHDRLCYSLEEGGKTVWKIDRLSP